MLVSHDARLIEEVTWAFVGYVVVVVCVQASVFLCAMLTHPVRVSAENARLGLSCGFATTKRFASAKSPRLRLESLRVQCSIAQHPPFLLPSTSVMFQSGIRNVSSKIAIALFRFEYIPETSTTTAMNCLKK